MLALYAVLGFFPLLARAQQWGDFDNSAQTMQGGGGGGGQMGAPFLPMGTFGGGCGNYGAFHSLPNNPQTNGPAGISNAPFAQTVLKQVLKNLPNLPPGANSKRLNSVACHSSPSFQQL